MWLMKTKIVRIGNSRGVRIPKPMLEEAGLGDEIELRLTDSGLVLEPLARPRVGWSDAARDLASSQGKVDADPFVANDFDDTDWEW
jgi:antitoxin MazE